MHITRLYLEYYPVTIPYLSVFWYSNQVIYHIGKSRLIGSSALACSTIVVSNIDVCFPHILGSSNFTPQDLVSSPPGCLYIFSLLQQNYLFSFHLPKAIPMDTRDDFQSDKDFPLESSGSDSNSTLLPRTDPWIHGNYRTEKSSRSCWRAAAANYRIWLLVLINTQFFLTSIGLSASGKFTAKAEECHCDSHSWESMFEPDCEKNGILERF
jgi:hypothetical protein